MSSNIDSEFLFIRSAIVDDLTFPSSATASRLHGPAASCGQHQLVRVRRLSKGRRGPVRLELLRGSEQRRQGLNATFAAMIPMHATLTHHPLLPLLPLPLSGLQETGAPVQGDGHSQRGDEPAHSHRHCRGQRHSAFGDLHLPQRRLRPAGNPNRNPSPPPPVAIETCPTQRSWR